MKVGDKVRCIKNISYGKYLVCDIDQIYTIQNFLDNDNYCRLNNMYFGLENINKNDDTPRFNEYFISLKEYRKKKLIKISEWKN